MAVGEDHLSTVKRALLTIESLQARLGAAEQAKSEPIAIIGIACRFPGGANDPDSFWDLMRAGVDAITQVPPARWDAEAFYNPDPGVPGKICTRYGGFIADHDRFDAQFFGISPREAELMDPQHRLLLTVSWEAIENAGQVRERLSGSQTGVFVGITANEYGHLQTVSTGAAEVNAYYTTGSSLNTAAGRLAFVFGFTGPCMAIDTACSSSLVAVHQACNSLRNGECEMALAAGVNLILSPIGSVALTQARALSPDGRCKTFDAAADGMSRGEGCGTIVLKRLSDALREGDSIVAVIRGSAINHDGPSSGLTVPNGPAQEAVIRQALANAKVLPNDVAYVETHGTGTPLGDPIEIEALSAAYGKERPKEHPLLIGSVKTNIGHLESSAGVAGLIKLAVSLQRGLIPPNLHFKQPSPHIRWGELPVAVVTRVTPWPRGTRPRLGAISSFGFSGTNVHIVVEEAPPLLAVQALADGAFSRPLHVLALSAKTEAALRSLVHRLSNYLALHPELDIEDLCFSANTGRLHFAHRLSLVAGSLKELIGQLEAFSSLKTVPGLFSGHARVLGLAEIAFVFRSGRLTSESAGQELYRTQPVFYEAVNHCLQYLDSSVRDLFMGTPSSADFEDEHRRACAPHLLFVIEYALAKLWRTWGIEPVSVRGAGVGEVVAACVAGVLSVEDAIKLLSSSQRVRQAGESAAVACWNLTPVARQVQLAQAKVRILDSNGEDITKLIATPQYWQEGISRTDTDCGKPFASAWPSDSVQIEIGVNAAAENSCPSGWASLLWRLAALYVHGATVDWNGFDRNYPRRRIPLPTYPFEGERYGLDYSRIFYLHDPAVRAANVTPPHPLVGRRLKLAGTEEIRFESELSAGSPAFLGEHRIFDVVAMPATGFVEMALAAARDAFKTEQVILTNLVIEQALILLEEDKKHVQLVLTPATGKAFSFRIFSSAPNADHEGAAWTLHASGTIEPGASEDNAPTVDSATLEASDGEIVDPLALYHGCRELGVDYGPSFRGLEQVRRANYSATGLCTVPEAARGFANDFLLHPVLLDCAFQLLGVSFPDADTNELFLPVGLDYFRLRRTGCLEGRASITIRPARSFPHETFQGDLTLTDKKGAVVAELRGLSIKRAKREALLRSLSRSNQPNDCLYGIAWRQKERGSSIHATWDRQSPTWLVFCPAGPLGEELTDELSAREQRCIQVRPGRIFQRVAADSFTLDPGQRTDFKRLLQELSAEHAISHLSVLFMWGIDDAQAPHESQLKGCGSLLHLVQALAVITWHAELSLTVVTKGAVSGDGAMNPVDPNQTAVWALSSVVALEHPALHCRRVDLDPLGVMVDVAFFLDEIIAPDAADSVSWRAGRRYVPRLVPQVFRTGATIAPRTRAIGEKGGTYLITGGLGALGLTTAEWLSERGARSLILVGRHEPSEPARKTIRGMQERGTRVHVVSGDIAEYTQAAAVFETAKTKESSLAGVVHAAGVLDDGVLVYQTWERFWRVMAPKIAGAWNLHLLTQNEPLEFFICFSSAAAVLGSPGQGNYVAANAFLDGLAYFRRARGLPGLSINWGPWAGSGMAAGTAVRYLNNGIKTLVPSQALESLGALLDYDAVQAVVFSVDWAEFSRHRDAPGLPPFFEECVSGAPHPRTLSSASVPNFALRDQLTARSAEDRQTQLVSYLREQVGAALRISPSRLEANLPLNSFGTDSLMAIELRNRIKVDLDVELPLVSFLEAISINSLASEISGHFSSSEISRISSLNLEKQSEFGPIILPEDATRLLSNLDQYTDEQVDGLLRAVQSERTNERHGI